MKKKIKLPAKKNTKKPTPKPALKNTKGDSNESRQGIFAEEISPLMNQFGETCHNLQIRTAVAIIQDPKRPQEIEIAIRGNSYEAATIVAETLKRLKAVMAQELEA